jgi:hypothetical protein
MLYVADVISFVFFCIHAPDAPFLQRHVAILSLKRHVTAPVGSGLLSGGIGGSALLAGARYGFKSDTFEFGFRCHYLPHFNSKSNTNTNLVE